MYTPNPGNTLSTQETAVLCALYQLGQQAQAGQVVSTAAIARLAALNSRGVEAALVSLEQRGLAWAARARLTLSGLAVAARLSRSAARALGRRHAA